MSYINLRQGDCVELLRELPDASVDCVLTDPPYASGGIYLRDRQRRVSEKYQNSETKKSYPEFFRRCQGSARLVSLGAALAGAVLACGPGRRAAFDVHRLAAAAHHDGRYPGGGMVLVGGHCME